MSETEFQNLAARVYIQQIVLAELCRKCFITDEVNRLFAQLSVAASKRDHESIESIEKAINDFRVQLVKPVMGSDC